MRTQPLRIDEVALLANYIKKTSSCRVMFDVGSRRGKAALPFVDAGWTVYAFEPDPGNQEELRSIASGRPHFFIDGRAVSDTTQYGVSFYTSPQASSLGSLAPFLPTHSATHKVDTVTLIDFCEDHRVERIGLLKIDAEGYDLPVLKGVPWNKAAPNVIICEYENRKTRPLGYEFADIAEFLNQHGYDILVSEWYPVKEYGGPHAWRCFHHYPCEVQDDQGWGNLIAFRDGIDWPVVLESVISPLVVKASGLADSNRLLRLALEQAREQLDYMNTSWSWRVTGPLRRLRAMFTTARPSSA